MNRTPLKRKTRIRRGSKRLKRSPIRRRTRKPKRAKKQATRADQKKALIKRLGGTPSKRGEWSELILIRDGFRCACCGRNDGKLQAHHWIVNAGRSLKTRFLLDNGVTLCFHCHIVRLHKQADLEVSEKIIEYMGLRGVGLERRREIRGLASISRGVSLEDLMVFADRFSKLRYYPEMLRDPGVDHA